MRKILGLAAIMMSVAATAEDRVTVSDLQVGKAPAGYPAVMGIAHNNSNASLSHVFVKFKLYDEDGAVVGNTLAVGQDIGPGENWKFVAPTSVPFAKAKLSSIEAN